MDTDKENTSQLSKTFHNKFKLEFENKAIKLLTGRYALIAILDPRNEDRSCITKYVCSIANETNRMCIEFTYFKDFERFVYFLEEKTHDTILPSIINFTTIFSENLSVFLANPIVNSQLTDTVHLMTFIVAMHVNKERFIGKTILIIDTKTGFLSFIAAHLESKKVYAIDSSEQLETHLSKLSKLNEKYTNINVIKDTFENENLDSEFDIVICENLIHNFLKKNTLKMFLQAKNFSTKTILMLPSCCKVNISLFSGKIENITETITHNSDKESKTFDTIYGKISNENCYSEKSTVVINFNELSTTDANEIKIPFSFTIKSKDNLNGFVLWFDYFFDGLKKFKLTSSPDSRFAQSEQLILKFILPLNVQENQFITGCVTLHYESSHYFPTIEFSIEEPMETETDNYLISRNSDSNEHKNTEQDMAIISSIKDKNTQNISNVISMNQEITENSCKRVHLRINDEKMTQNFTENSTKQFDVRISNDKDDQLITDVINTEIFVYRDKNSSSAEYDQIMKELKTLKLKSGRINIITFDKDDTFFFESVIFLKVCDKYSVSETKKKRSILNPMPSVAKQYLESALEIFKNDLKVLITNEMFSDETCKTIIAKARSYFLSKMCNYNEKKQIRYNKKFDKSIVTLTSTYNNVNQIIYTYKRKWKMIFEQWNHKKETELIQINNSVKETFINDIIKLKSKEEILFIKSSWNLLFESYRTLNSKRYFDSQFDEFITQMTKIYDSRVTYILKLGLFSKIEIKSILSNVQTHIIAKIKYYKGINGFASINDYHIEKLINALKEKQSEINLLKLYKSFEETLDILNQIRNDSLIQYNKGMANSTVNIDQNLFNDFHQKCKTDAITYHNDNTRTIKKYFALHIYEKIISNNASYLLNEIENEKVRYESNINSKVVKDNHLAIYYGSKELIASYFDEKVLRIGDNSNCIKENSLAFYKGQIFFEYEYHPHYTKLHPYKLSQSKTMHEFLLAGEKTFFNEAELNQYRINYNKSRINSIDSHKDDDYLSMETLIALQILNTKIDAEDYTNKCFSSLVLTIPDNYDMNFINALIRISKLVDFKSINFLTELNAMALSFIFLKKKLRHEEKRKVFIINLNLTHYNSAVCLVSRDRITYRCYSQESLKNESNLLNNFILKLKQWFTIDGFEGNAKLDKTLTMSECYKLDIQDVILAGNSYYKQQILEILKKTFKNAVNHEYNVFDLSNGAAVYANLIENNLKFKIYETAKHDIVIKIYYHLRRPTEVVLVKKNQLIKNIQNTFEIPDNQFPIDILIYENQKCFEHYVIPSENSLKDCQHKFIFCLDSNFKLRIHYSIESNLNQKSINDFKMEFDDRTTFMENEKIKFEFYKESLRKKKELIKKESQARTLMNELKCLCEEFKSKLEINKELSRLQKKKSEELNEKALSVLYSRESKTNDFEKQIEIIRSSLLKLNLN